MRYISLLTISLLLGATHSYGDGHYGVPLLPIVAIYLQCQGSESQLSDCYGFDAYQQYTAYCQTSSVAGVKCLCMSIHINYYLYYECISYSFS